MVDTLHAGRAGVTAEELARTNSKYFNFIHLCDGPAGPDGDPVLDNIKDDLMLFTARECLSLIHICSAFSTHWGTRSPWGCRAPQLCTFDRIIRHFIL